MLNSMISQYGRSTEYHVLFAFSNENCQKALILDVISEIGFYKNITRFGTKIIIQ